VVDAAVQIDGRRRRREQNRDAALDALGELFREGNFQPSSAEIAERAGLSPRSLFRYFDDVDDLSRAAIERQLRHAAPLVDPGVGPDDPTASKIERVVAARVRLFETVAPAARAARVCAHRQPRIAAKLAEDRACLRDQLGRVFAPELADSRRCLLAALDALCSFETHDLLRVDQRLSRSETEATLITALQALLGGDPT